MSESNLTNFVKCKEPVDDKTKTDQKIITKENCINTGLEALKEIKGSQLEPYLKEAIDTSIIRIKSEIKVLKMLSDTTSRPEDITKIIVPQRLILEAEKTLWNEVQVEAKKLDGTYVKTQKTYEWIPSLIIGVTILFFLHYINNKDKIDEKVKNNTKNNKK